MRLEIQFVDDKEGKPVDIQIFIGRRPIAAFSNSAGDLQRLEWTTAGNGARFGRLVHQTEAERDWAYDRHSQVGPLDKALDAVPGNHWVEVGMQTDWKRVFRLEQKGKSDETKRKRKSKGIG